MASYSHQACIQGGGGGGFKGVQVNPPLIAFTGALRHVLLEHMPMLRAGGAAPAAQAMA